MPALGTAMSRRPWRVERVLDEPLEVRVVAHVADLDGGAGLGREALERLRVAPGGDDLGAGRAQDAHEALAEAPRGARDDRDAAIEAEQAVDLGRGIGAGYIVAAVALPAGLS